MNTDKDTRKISEMRNLGPACEKDLNAVGIHCAQQVIDLGVEATFIKMLNGKLNSNRAAKSCNAAYLYALHGAVHDLDWQEVPEAKKDEYKRFTAELRASGKFS